MTIHNLEYNWHNFTTNLIYNINIHINQNLINDMVTHTIRKPEVISKHNFYYVYITSILKKIYSKIEKKIVRPDVNF